MAPKKSEIWSHFSDETNGKVKCSYCGQILSVKNKSTSTLIRHMNNKHPTQTISRQRVLEPHLEEIEENMETPSTSAQQSTKQAEVSSSFTSTTKQGQPAQSSSVSKLQSITSFFQRPLSMNKQKEIDKQLICMITKEYHPFSIIEDQEFRRLLNLLNPSYKIPTRKTVSNSLIPAFYNQIVDIVKERIERAFAVCITTDGWTSRSNDSFFSVTAHYIVEEEKRTFLTSDLLGCISYTERHTAENISNMLKEVINEWKITNKIAAIVSDNAANMKAAVRHGGWRYWGCFAHSLNLVTQSGLCEIKEVVDKIKVIVTYFKRSSHACAQLKATAERMDMPPLKLKNDVVTRWNSTYDMIARFLKMKNAIISTLAILNTSSNRNQREEFASITQLENEEWILAEQAIEVFEIFNLVTIAISTETSISASTIIFYYKQIVKHLNKFDINKTLPQIENLIKKLQLELKNRFQDIESNNLIAQATILDPRFKKFGFIDENKFRQAQEILYTKVASTKLLQATLENTNDTNITENNSKQDIHSTSGKDDALQSLWQDFDMEVQQHLKPNNPRASAILEVDKYLDEPILPRKDNSGISQDPFIWWHHRKHIYPRLYQIMKTRLCIMATSVPSERVFSKAGQIINEKRERLKTNKASQVIFLSYNLNNND